MCTAPRLPLYRSPWLPPCHCEALKGPWQSVLFPAAAPLAPRVIVKAQPLAALPPYGCGLSACRSERSDVAIRFPHAAS